jgi:hypothetical protein
MPANSLQSYSFAALAKRITVWTTNSLLTLIVLVAGLGFGRQVLNWWAAGASPSPTVVNSVNDPAQIHTFQFGDNSWSLSRRSVTGDKNKAVEQLRVACREALEAGPSAAALPADDRFLTFLAGSTPVDQKPGKWRLYELNDAFPMTVGVATTSLAEHRVVVWGLAMPTGDKQWTLSTFQSEVCSTGGQSGLSDVPLPPGSRRTLSLLATGGGIIAFSGPDRSVEWKNFYDEWSAHQGWQQVASWQPTGTAWYAKFATPDDLIDIRFGPDGHGGLSGLLMITPQESR